MRFWGLSLLVLLAARPEARAWVSPAPDVVLYCTPALDAALHRVARSFTAAQGAEVHIFVAPPDGLLGLIKHRARDDVVVADAATIGTLAAAGEVRPGSALDLGRDPFVLIGKEGVALPAGAGVAQLVAAYPMVLPDPTSAASFDGAAVLRAAAQDAAPARLIGVSDTPTVIARVREDGGLIGVVHQTESSGPGLSKVATLPVPPTEMRGALVTMGQSGNAAPFLDFLAGAAGRAILQSSGLEPNP